jgi:hypothetical protein
MIDDRDESIVHQAAASLRQPGARDTEVLEELLATIRAESGSDIGDDGVRSRATLTRRRPRMTRGAGRFIAGLAAGVAFAAGLGLGIFAGWRMRGESYRLAAEDLRRPAGFTSVANVGDSSADAGPQPVQFMFVAPAATRVALVGEFNDWDPAATPMARAGGGAWHVALPLNSGRHVYAFVVDGSSWVADPQAPLAPERWFGAQNSVVLVSRGLGGRP